MQKHSDKYLAVKYVMGLTHQYSKFVDIYKLKLREWPTSLVRAYLDADSFCM
jgi:hypothetical protein